MTFVPKRRRIIPAKRLRSTGPFLRPLLFALLFLIGGVAADSWAVQGPPGGMPPASVVLSQVAKVKRSNTESFIGTIVPIRKSVIGSAVGGRVAQVLVEEGDHVGFGKEMSEFDNLPLGDPIVQLRTTTLDLEIQAAEVELKLRELAEQELRETLPLEIEQAKADVAEIQSRLEYSRENFQRLKRLFESSGVSEREMLEAASLFHSQTELQNSAQANLRKLTTTEQTRLAQAVADVDNQRAAIRRLRETRENYTVRSPFDGYITSKMTETGQWLAPGQAVVEIVQLDPIDLVVNVPQVFVQSVQRLFDQTRELGSKMPVHVAIDSIDRLFEGELVQIVPQADLRSRAFPVKIRLANPLDAGRPLIKAGMLGKASFFIGDETEQLMVKKDALVLGPRVLVYVAVANPETEKLSARPVEVEIGAASGEWIVVKGLLNPGDRVVVQGNERLLPGQELNVLSEQPDSPPSPDSAEAGATTAANGG